MDTEEEGRFTQQILDYDVFLFLRQTQGLFVLEQVIRHPMKFVINCSASANTSITDNELWDFVRKKPEISSNDLE